MTVPAKVGEPLPLVALLEDGNETQYPQAEIYESGGTTPIDTVDLDHKAKGRYEATWTPTTVGSYSSLFIIYSDTLHSVESIVYSRAVEQIFVSQSDVDDLASSIVRLLGLNHENAFIDTTIFDGNGQLLSARIRLYDSKANAQAAQDGDSYSTGLVATYTMEADYQSPGKLRSYRYVRDS